MMPRSKRTFTILGISSVLIVLELLLLSEFNRAMKHIADGVGTAAQRAAGLVGVVSAAARPSRPLNTKQPEQNTATIPGQKPSPKPGEVWENPKDGLKYVWIPPGTFTMGCSPGDSECWDEEKPAHQVTLTKGFWMGQTEVTVGAYQRFVAATGRKMPPPHYFNLDWAHQDMPIVNVIWDEAQAYCLWTGGRLPTEAEWEYSARAGNTEPRYGPLDDIAWFWGNSGGQFLDSMGFPDQDQASYFKRLIENGNSTHAVGQKQANAFGLYDMLGNAWEWVNDRYDEHYYRKSPSTDPAGPGRGRSRVLRGGSWRSGTRNVRVSFRLWYLPDSRFEIFGVRCATDVAVRP